MNSKTIYISSNSSSTVETLDTIFIDDLTEVSLDLTGVYSGVIPIYLKLDWGDGDIETYDNDIYQVITADNINIINNNTMFTTLYTKKVYPSSTKLYKNIHVQVYVGYSNGESSTFLIPLSIRTNDFFGSIGDLKLINVNLLPHDENPKEYQLSTFVDNTIIELRNDS
jgi:hypothetical protein